MAEPIENSIAAVLFGDSTLTEMTEGRIYPLRAKTDVVPCVVYSMGNKQPLTDRRNAKFTGTFVVESRAADYIPAKKLAKEVRRVLHSYKDMRVDRSVLASETDDDRLELTNGIFIPRVIQQFTMTFEDS